DPGEPLSAPPDLFLRLLESLAKPCSLREDSLGALKKGIVVDIHHTTYLPDFQPLMHINGRCSIDGSSSKDLTGFVHGAGTTFLLARYPLSFSKAQEIIMLRAALAVATL